MHARFCLCPPRLQSLLPQSCESLVIKYHGLQVQIPRGFLAPLSGMQLGSLMRGSKPSQQWENLFGINVLQFVGHPPGRYGVCFYCDCAPLTTFLWLVLCLCTWAMFFGGFQCPPIDGCSTPSCDFGALTGADELISFYSDILNQKPFFSPFVLSRVSCAHRGPRAEASHPALQTGVLPVEWLFQHHS